MRKVLTFKNPEMVTSKEGRVKLVELKVNIEEICAIHKLETGQHVLAVFIHEKEKNELGIPACFAFHISKEDYEIAKPIFSKYIKKQKGEI